MRNDRTETAPRIRRPRFGTPAFGVALLALALFLVWLFLTPYHPERADDSIPAQAHWVSWHHAPGERWAELSGNPLVAMLLSEALGAEAARDIAGRELPARIRRLTADRVILARATVDDTTERAAWFAAAWAGSHGRLLRWQLKLFRVPGIDRYGQHGGRPLYRIETPGLPPGERLFLTFEEGLVLMCLSSDPHDIRLMLDAHDGRVDSIRDLEPPPRLDTVADRARLRDTGFFRPGFDLDFLRLTSGETEARLYAGERRAHGTRTRPAPDSAPAPPWDEWPEATAVYFPDRFPPWPASSEFDFLNALQPLSEALGDPAFLAAGLFGPPFSGRFRGIQVPGLVLAWPTEQTMAEVETAVRRTLDRINAERRWGLILAADPHLPRNIRRIVGTAPNAFSTFPPDETPALALYRQHLLLASNVQTLSRLIERNPDPDRRLLSDPDSAADVGFRVDLERAMPTLRLLYGAYWLYQVMERRAPESREQDVMEGIGRRLDHLEPLGILTLHVDLAWPAFTLHLHAQHPQRPNGSVCTSTGSSS